MIPILVTANGVLAYFGFARVASRMEVAFGLRLPPGSATFPDRVGLRPGVVKPIGVGELRSAGKI